MPITSMLRQLRPVIAREPAIFVKALAATCHVEEWGSRAMVMLRSTKQVGGPAAIEACALHHSGVFGAVREAGSLVMAMLCTNKQTDALHCGTAMLMAWEKALCIPLGEGGSAAPCYA